MARQNTRNPRDRRHEGQKRDAAGSSLRVHSLNRDTRETNEREREPRQVSLNRYDWNDLYERSSI
jgi:hypothetical protein